MDTALQIFLVINVFFIGALSVLGWQYFRAHKHPPEKSAIQQPVELPKEVKERLLQAAQLDFETVLRKTGRELQHDQLQLADKLTERLDKLGNTIVDDEMKRYRAKLDELRTNAESTIARAHAETEQHQNDLDAAMEKRRSEIEAQMQAEAKATTEKMQRELDTKLSDAMLAFLTETLQHNIDIGAQQNYLLSVLEEHKQELIEGVTHE